MFCAAPRFLATLATHDDLDNAHLRYKRTSLTATGVQITVEEDTTAGNETTHSAEAASYLAIENSGVWTDFTIEDIHLPNSHPPAVNGASGQSAYNPKWRKQFNRRYNLRWVMASFMVLSWGSRPRQRKRELIIYGDAVVIQNGQATAVCQQIPAYQQPVLPRR